jgi:hypothetical protein
MLLGGGSAGVRVDTLLALAQDTCGQPGWCNGDAGLAVANQVHCEILDAGPSAREKSVSAAWRAVDTCDKSMPAGLCHGAAGVYAVAAGIGRGFGEPELLGAAQQGIQGVVLQATSPRLGSGLTIDHSWLTGIAGILWSLAVCTAVPVVNPLNPIDSLIWLDGRR